MSDNSPDPIPVTVSNQPEHEEERAGVTPAQWWLISFIVAFTTAAFFYRALVLGQLTHTAAMFLGVPSLLAILLAFTPRAKSITGGIVKAMTLFLLVIAPLLGEGYLCILIASPIFYGVAVLIGVILDAARKRKRGNATLSCMALLVIPMCLEGIVPQFTFPRDQTVEVTSIVNTSAPVVEAALAQSPDLNVPLPRFLRIGFPRPLAAYGSGLEIGATRAIHFSGAEGDPAGDLVSRVAARGPGFIRTETVSDSTKLTQWLRWQSSEVFWHAVDGQHTAVTWRVHFERGLDPAWYFTPWERFAVAQSARYLIEANATPRQPAQ
jgi:hypothetical protein